MTHHIVLACRLTSPLRPAMISGCTQRMYGFPVVQALEDLYVHYDNTVRNAAGGIVQFTYGDDGMDPVTMEGGNGAPLDLNRTLAKVRGGQPESINPLVAFVTMSYQWKVGIGT